MNIILNQSKFNRLVLSESREDLDMNILNFLRRRAIVTKQNVADIEVTNVMFGGSGYGFNSFSTRRKMESEIMDLLYEAGLSPDLFELPVGQYDVTKQKVLRTIRYFLNEILPKDKRT